MNIHNTDPRDADTDDDGVDDTRDLCSGTTDIFTVDSNGCAENQRDSDNDGISDAIDVCADTSSLDIDDIVDSTGCALSQLDTDSDTLSDYEETVLYGTNSHTKDSDKDGLTDPLEIQLYKTNPLDKDTDEDGFNDGDEVNNGTDPTVADVSICFDTDGGLVYKTKGTISGGLWYITNSSYQDKTDSCVNVDKVREYYCTNNKGYYITRSCSTRFGLSSYCFDGACVLE